jgi:hypothetical protein
MSSLIPKETKIEWENIQLIEKDNLKKKCLFIPRRGWLERAI